MSTSSLILRRLSLWVLKLEFTFNRWIIVLALIKEESINVFCDLIFLYRYFEIVSS